MKRVDSVLVWFAEHGVEAPLGEAAVRFAGEEAPDLDLEGVRADLDAVARGFRAPASEPLPLRIARLTHHLAVERGFAGDDETYDDPENSLLHRVLARRKGLPILLSVLWIEVARRGGLALLPVGYPGHFLVTPKAARGAFFLDPFHGGKVHTRDALVEAMGRRGLDPDDADRWLRPVTSAEVIVRMGRNLEASYRARGRSADLERLVARRGMLARWASQAHV